MRISGENILEGKVPGESNGIQVKKTVCGMCTPLTHCGIDAYVKDGVVVKVEGSKDNPHSEGTLCSKGSASRQFIYHPDRLMTPQLKRGGRDSQVFVSISWDQAFEISASRLSKIKKESGPESVVFFSGYIKWYRPPRRLAGARLRSFPRRARVTAAVRKQDVARQPASGHGADEGDSIH